MEQSVLPVAILHMAGTVVLLYWSSRLLGQALQVQLCEVLATPLHALGDCVPQGWVIQSMS